MIHQFEYLSSTNLAAFVPVCAGDHDRAKAPEVAGYGLWKNLRSLADDRPGL